MLDYRVTRLEVIGTTAVFLIRMLKQIFLFIMYICQDFVRFEKHCLIELWIINHVVWLVRSYLEFKRNE